MMEVVQRIKAAATQEQSAGIEQVNKAMMQMDQVTQQNAALVEEAAAASQAIVDQAAQLATLVAKYRVGAEMAATTPSQVKIPGASGAVRAPKPAAAAVSERRGPRRPFVPKAQPQSQPPRQKAAGGDDGEWTEF
jgi:hypothetical protein